MYLIFILSLVSSRAFIYNRCGYLRLCVGFVLQELYLCSGVDLCEVVRVGTHHCAGCCVSKAAELSRGSSSGPTQTGICTLRCHSGLLQPRCWSRSGTPAGDSGGSTRRQGLCPHWQWFWRHSSSYFLWLFLTLSLNFVTKYSMLVLEFLKFLLQKSSLMKHNPYVTLTCFCYGLCDR